MSMTINTLQSALASVERVFDILDEEEVEPEPEPGEAAPCQPPRRRPRRLQARALRLLAGQAAHARTSSFTAEPGQKIAIVGATGAGRLDPHQSADALLRGRRRAYTLDGVDTRKMDRGELRSNFGMVLQDAWLFDGTIAENIAYGRPEATREEIECAARAAHVDFFVRTMPAGL